MNSLYINAWCENGQYCVDIKTFVVIYIYKLANSCNIKLKVKVLKEIPSVYILVNLDNLQFEILSASSELVDLCTWPVLLVNKHVISGLCSVSRHICKISDKEDVKNLLGFREACLVACAESSIWTKFCEIDMIQTVFGLLNNDFVQNSSFILPENILKYENHLSQPVRIHNIYKIARNNHNDQSLKSSTQRKDLKVLHEYAEGPYMTLADMILYPCFQIFFKYCHKYSLSNDLKIPLIKTWFNKLKASALPDIILNFKTLGTPFSNIIIPIIDNVSLYNADPTRSLSVKHTKQYKIESALDIIEKIRSEINNDLLPFGDKTPFSWEDIPLEANPQGGALPAKRAERKCEQLENMIKATVEVVGRKKYRIVDFCSGSGHLGILIGLVLPNCQIILVENKERSLARARETISKLNLNNIVIVQSNLDYFVGDFDLGLALHACGVATDLVLQMCIKNKADFVCCPCCYGGIKDCHEISYPRSSQFQSVFHGYENHYFYLAHAADQTHEKQNSKTAQGYLCMDVIDTDRRFYAEGCGYKVHLGKLQPVTCTNKNNLLVGINLEKNTK